MKKIIILVIIILKVANVFANITPPWLIVRGANPAWEGSQEEYFFSYNGTSIPSGLQLTFSITNGQIIGTPQADPYINGSINVKVQWNCNAPSGVIRITDISGQFYDYNVTLWTYSNYTDFCNKTEPVTQDVLYNQQPQLLTVTNCSPYCHSLYNFSYQWQIGDVDIDNPGDESLIQWHNLPLNSNNETYQPVPLLNYGIKAFRRITTYIQPNETVEPVTVYSKAAYVRFLTQLDPGVISADVTTINSFHQVPVINATQAVGGLCEAINYVYTWQMVNPSTGGWIDIGNTEQFPVNAPEVAYSTTYRRKIVCGAETKYTNELLIIFRYESAYAENINYIREIEVHTPGITTWEAADGFLDFKQKNQQTTYFDGLWRPIQTIGREAGTPDVGNSVWKDIVNITRYNNFGQVTEKYLPYATQNSIGMFKTDALAGLSDYYNTNYQQTDNLYSAISFETSPLNRVTNIKSPISLIQRGQGNSTLLNEHLFVTDEKVPMLSIGSLPTDLPVFNGYYSDFTLFKNITTDENNTMSIDYTDKSGKLIMKKVQLKETVGLTPVDGWLTTCYVYDGLDKLRYTIEPEAVTYFDNANWVFNNAESEAALNKLCFKYVYDKRGRVVIKKNPGAEEIQMVYDKKDRLILSQDGNQRSGAIKKWTLTVFDELDRPVISAEYLTAATMQQLKDEVESLSAEDANELFLHQVQTPGVGTILKYYYYDDYSYQRVKPFDNSFQNNLAYSSGDIRPIKQSNRTLGYLTGTSVLVLGTSNYLISTIYYNEQGNEQQTISDNILQGEDVSTKQYHWDGRLLSNEIIHHIGSSPDVRALTKNNFDKLGRITSIDKKFYSNPFKTVVSYEYDDLSRVKVKHLDPGYIGFDGTPDIETQNFSYNIEGWLKGINKDYALKSPGLYEKWGNANGKFFGMCLGYDNNEDGVFGNASLLTGQIAAQVWNTMGDDNQRKYEYTYDRVGRIVKADFTQRKAVTDVFDNTKLDYTVKGRGYNEQVTYDLNGNLTNLIHKGVVLGDNVPREIDNLEYGYEPLVSGSAYHSNTLQKVFDNSSMGNANGILGDFKDGLNGNTEDYSYDANGNLTLDMNKQIMNVPAGTILPGVKYNYLNKPEEIDLEATSTKPKRKIKITYDADGNKLSSSYQEHPPTGDIRVTHYIGEFIYTEVVSTSNAVAPELSQINFGEGRIRVMENIQPTGAINSVTLTGNIILPNGKNGAYDFFIMDNLQNTRMIVTEEVHEGTMTCTNEPTLASIENQVFWQSEPNGMAPPPASGVIIDKSLVPNWNDNTTGSKVVKLSKNNRKVGPNVLLKVMAGDEVSASSIYYYENYTPDGPGSTNLFNTVAHTFVSSMLGNAAVPDAAKDPVVNAAIEGWYNTDPNSAFANIVSPAQQEDGRPKAYLSVLFFDERFNFLPDESMSQRVGDPGNNPNPYPLALTNIRAPKNGYVYIYVSNESNTPVYFDFMQVNFKRGRIVEENHYYPHGLKIATLSSEKLGNVKEGILKNNYLYQGAYSEHEDETGWNDFALRNYDPQIGRWIQQDPYDEFPSPYVGMGNNPAMSVDPLGGDTWISDMAIGTAIGAGIGALWAGIKKQSIWKGATLGGIFGAGVGSAYALANNASGVTGADGNFTPGFNYVFNGLLAANTVMLSELIFHHTNLTERGKKDISDFNDLFNSTVLALGTGILDGYIKNNVNMKVNFSPVIGSSSNSNDQFDFAPLVASSLYGFLDRLIFASRHSEQLSLGTHNKILGYSVLGLLDGIGSGIASNIAEQSDDFSQQSMFGATLISYSLLPHRKLGIIAGWTYGLATTMGLNFFNSLGHISEKNGGYRFGLISIANYLYFKVLLSVTSSNNQFGGSVNYTRR